MQRHSLAGRSIGAHLHGEFVVDITLGGEGELYAHGERFQLDRKTICLMGPDIVHSAKAVSSQRWEFVSIYIPTQTAACLVSGTPPLALPPTQLIRDFATLKYGEQFIGALGNDHYGERCIEAFVGFLKSAFAHVKAGMNCRSDKFKKLHMAATMMSRNFHKKLTLEEIAAHIGMSTPYFSYRFKSYTGVSPHQFLLAQKLANASILLRTNMLLTEIAQECGFYDQSHFSDHFKRAHSVTPSKYRRFIHACNV